MVSAWTITYCILLCAACFASAGMRRVQYWIGLSALSFVDDAVLWRVLNPASVPVASLVVDALFCLVVAKTAKEKWEVPIYLYFWGSVIVSCFQIGGLIPITAIYTLFMSFWDFLLISNLLLVGLVERGKSYGPRISTLHRSLHRPNRPPR